MGYQQINFTSVANMISQLETQMASAGWTDTGLTGALGGSIYVSTADTDGRVCYVQLYTDTASRLGMGVCPLLNAGATDFETLFQHRRACDFQAGNWECFIYDDFVHCSRGTDPDNFRMWYGRYYALPNTDPGINKWMCTLHGTHGIDGGAAQRPRPLTRSNSGGFVYYSVSWGWGIFKRIGLMQFTNVWSTGPASSWAPDIGFLDNTTLMCSIPVILGSEGNNPDRGGLLGYLPHAIHVAKDIPLNAADRVTLDSGVTYYRLATKTSDYDWSGTEHHLLFEE